MHRNWEVREESRATRVSYAADRTGDNSPDLLRRDVEKTRERLHEQLKVVADRIYRDFEKRIECNASRALRDWVRNEVHKHRHELCMTGASSLSSSSPSQIHLAAVHAALLTPESASASPTSTIGHTALSTCGPMSSETPSTATPSARSAIQRALGSGCVMYYVISWRRVGNL